MVVLPEIVNKCFETEREKKKYLFNDVVGYHNYMYTIDGMGTNVNTEHW